MWFPTVPDGQAYLKLISECHAQHADPSIQHSYSTQSPDILSLHQVDYGGGGEGKSRSSLHPDSPFEVSRRSKLSKDMPGPGSRRDKSMSNPSVSHLRPLCVPPAFETLRPLPPALPSTILSPLPTPAIAGTPHLPISLSTNPSSFQDHQSQGLTGDALSIDYPESQDPGDLHSQLSLSPGHKNSIEWAPSANSCTKCKSRWSTRLQNPIIRYGGQQEIPEHGVSALQETGHLRGSNVTPGSSGQSFDGFRLTPMRFQR
jgi:hypothetical protein